MRRLTAFICLVCFFAIQYGRIMSYWECRLRASSIAEKCDCEKIITAAAGDKGQLSAAFPVKGVSEECYDHDYQFLPGLPAPDCHVNQFAVIASPLLDATTKGIFQPPRVRFYI